MRRVFPKDTFKIYFAQYKMLSKSEPHERFRESYRSCQNYESKVLHKNEVT